MKITVNNKTLSNALTLVNSVVERRNTIPILSNIYVAANADGTVTLQGTDLDTTIKTTISDVVIDGTATAFTASAAMLSDIVKRLPNGDVKLEYDGETLHVKSGRSKFKMQTLPSVDFPQPVASVMQHGFTCSASDMKRWLDRVSFCMSSEETRYFLCGVYMHVNDGALRLVATDGHRLAKQEMTVTCDSTSGIIIPRKAIAEMAKLCTGDSVTVNWNDRAITFANDTATLTSKLVDGSFPDYERVIPSGNDKRLVIDADTIKAASDRVASVNDEKTRAVKIECRNGEVDLSVTARNDNSANEIIDASCDFDLVIGVNSRYFADAMSRIDGEASLEFADASMPMIIREVGDDSYLSLIMPVRVM